MKLDSYKYVGKFWSVIDDVCKMGDCDSAFVLRDRLVTVLSKLSNKEIVIWERVLEEYLNTAMHNTTIQKTIALLDERCYCVNGCAENFIAWLMVQCGRKFFQEFLITPDLLADRIDFEKYEPKDMLVSLSKEILPKFTFASKQAYLKKKKNLHPQDFFNDYFDDFGSAVDIPMYAKVTVYIELKSTISILEKVTKLFPKLSKERSRIKEQLKNTPGDVTKAAKALCRKGLYCHRAGDIREALTSFTSAIKIAPEYHRAYLHAAKCIKDEVLKKALEDVYKTKNHDNSNALFEQLKVVIATKHM